MQPPGRSRSCAAAGVRERQTPKGRRTHPAPAHKHPQPLRSQYCTSSCKVAQVGSQQRLCDVEQVRQPDRQPAGAHMQGRTMAAKVPMSGCLDTWVASSCTPATVSVHILKQEAWRVFDNRKRWASPDGWAGTKVWKMPKLLKGVLSAISRHWPSHSQLTLFVSRELLASTATLPKSQTGQEEVALCLAVIGRRTVLPTLIASGCSCALRVGLGKNGLLAALQSYTKPVKGRKPS